MRTRWIMAAYCILSRLLLLTVAPVWSEAAEFKCGRFCLVLDDAGKPLSLRGLPGGEEVLNPRSPGTGFYLQGPGGQRTPLSHITADATGGFTARSADGRQAVVFGTVSQDRYLALRIEKLDGIQAEPGVSLHLELNADTRLRVTELDYMTAVQNGPYGVRVHWVDLWHHIEGAPMGGVALFTRQNEADEDETLLHIWVQENLPHPKVEGDWTLDRARAWVAEWQKTFADRSQMILEGETIEELRAGLPWAEKAKIREIFLFTQTWRTDNFWPGAHGNLHVNRQLFPRGEEDLRAFSDLVHSKGMRLNLHYFSGGIGLTDPTYVGIRPDRRLADWVRGTLTKAAGPADAELVFRPDPGASYPPALLDFFHHNHVRLEDEIVHVGSCEPLADGTWLLHKCRRGQSGTRSASHAVSAEAQGLVVAYGQNYVPDNDSSLLDEMARNYAAFLNRCGISHSEYDGAEIHCYNGGWGYRKFATRVYENLDHPVTAHDSSGRAPRCNFEYRLNSTRTLLAGTCPFTHGNWSAPVQLASPARVASTVLDANFVLSQGHLGGAMGLCKPEPMFAVSDRALRTHGLSDRLIQTLLDWKAASPLLTDVQRAAIDKSFGRPSSRMPEHSHHVTSRFVQTIRKTDHGYQIVPVCVMTRKSGDIPWQQGQEHGAVSPRQYVKPGEELLLENPFGPQPAQFIIRVLWAFDPRGPTETIKRATSQAAASPAPSDVFTAGNQTKARVANLILQPALNDLHVPGDAPLKTLVSEDGAALRLSAENTGPSELWAKPDRLPQWNAAADMTSRRGIGLRVTGDGSGALLLFMISGRDYFVPIDFVGPRDVEIPNGEVAWSSAAWGWRMSAKHANYACQRQFRLGFGYLPPKTKASVQVERLTALAEIPACLENPIIHVGAGTLTVHGQVESGQYLQFEGGDSAAVFDENWNKQRDLRVTKDSYCMPSGWAPFAIQAASSAWLEVQFLTEGEPMVVPFP